MFKVLQQLIDELADPVTMRRIGDWARAFEGFPGSGEHERATLIASKSRLVHDHVLPAAHSCTTLKKLPLPFGTDRYRGAVLENGRSESDLLDRVRGAAGGR